MSENSRIEWVSYPAGENKRVAIFVLIFILGLSSGIYYLYGIIYGILSILILSLSLLNYFTPTEYILNDEGVKVKRVLNKEEIRWDKIRSYYPDKNGVLLSPFPVPSRLENFRGTFIKFSGNRDEVLEYIRKKMNGEEDEEED